MFHFPTFPPHALCVQARVTPHDWCGVPPFGNPRINARLTAPRGLSQPPTSFIGSWCQGIHRAPLKTWPHKKPHTHPRKETSARTYTNPATNRVRRCSRPLCSSQRTTRHPPHDPTRPGHPHRDTSGMRNRKALPETNGKPGQPGSPLPQDPTACLRTEPTPPPRSTRHPEGGRRTRSSTSCRPNWSAFHPRAPPQKPAARPE
jgi:hypothetical protein